MTDQITEALPGTGGADDQDMVADQLQPIGGAVLG
jgi:hypothetical protein